MRRPRPACRRYDRGLTWKAPWAPQGQNDAAADGALTTPSASAGQHGRRYGRGAESATLDRRGAARLISAPTASSTAAERPGFLDHQGEPMKLRTVALSL